MRQTLFYIPSEIAGVPTFGWGWLLAVWLFVGLILACRGQHNKSYVRAIGESLPFMLIGAAVIVFVLPRLQQSRLVDDVEQPLGLPVRGYGVLMFVAIVAGVGLAVRRAQRIGLPADVVYALALWLFAAGFLGARIFFIMEYFDEFRADSWGEFLLGLANIAEGGLVVYGSLIGALLAFLLFVRRHDLPMLPIADLLAPSMLLGLAIGRIGCLLNGCCYGGPCEYPWALRFPIQSPPYMEQLTKGLSQGFFLLEEDGVARVGYVEEGSPVGISGIVTGNRIVSIDEIPISQGKLPGRFAETIEAKLLSAPGTPLSLKTEEGERIQWAAGYAPERSFPIHPTQIYSSLNALAIFGLVLALSPFARRDGLLLAVTLTLYPLTRFLLEMIRIDEANGNALGLTISQTVSLPMLVVAMLLWWWVLRQPVGRLSVLDSPSLPHSASLA